MKNKKRYSLLLLVLMSLLLVFAACADGEDADADATPDAQTNDTDDESVDEPVENPDPVTLRVALGAGEEDFIEKYKKPVEDLYDHITVEQVPFSPNDEVIQDQLAAGNVPDIIHGGSAIQLHVYEQYELLTDHTDLIEKHDMNIELFNQGFLEFIRSHSAEGELWALPIDMTRYALHYSKDIFDQFGVDYPEEGMSWQEVVDLSREVSGELNGVEYIGLMLPAWDSNISTVPAPLVAPDTDQPLFTQNPLFANLLGLYEQTYLHPLGPEPGVGEIQAFIGDRTLAMLPTYFLWSDWTGLKDATEQGMNWDITTFPVWDADDPRSGMAGGRWLAVTEPSEHKDEAFLALQVWLDKERVGEILEGPLTVPYNNTATAEMIEELGVDEVLEEKNIEALFKYPTLEERPELSIYQYEMYPLVNGVISEFINPESGSNKDINTVLRELQEAAEILIEDLEKIE